MRKTRGFTVVELVVVMIIMAILIGLSIMSITSNQANARDHERLADIDQVMRGLERYYNEANSNTATAGRYPDITLAANLPTNSMLPGVATGAFTYSSSSVTPSFVVAVGPAGRAVDSTATVASQLTTRNTFVYEPSYYDSATNSWKLCGAGSECLRYVIYYTTEKTGSTIQIKTGDRR